MIQMPETDLTPLQEFHTWLVRVAVNPERVPPYSAIRRMAVDTRFPAMKIANRWYVATTTMPILATMVGREVRRNYAASALSRRHAATLPD